MASLMLLLLVLVMSMFAQGYNYYGGSITFTPKGKNSDGTYMVELRNKQTNYYCTQNNFRCTSGNCGIETERTITTVSQNSYGYYWCHREVVMKRKIHGNRPFEIRYPTSYYWRSGQGYWISNTHGRYAWTLAVHVDLGIRSDTGEPNRSPTTTSNPPLRITQNCPRRYSLIAFDHDGDQVRCRFGKTSPFECSLCYEPEGFSLDQNSCTLSYSYTRTTGTSAFELIVEDFPTTHVTVSYSDGSHTFKSPLVGGRHRRDVTINTTATVTATTVATITTTTTRAATTTTDAITTTEPTTTASTTTTTPAATAAPTTTTTPATTATTAAPTPTTTTTPATTAAPTTTTTTPATTAAPTPTTTTTPATTAAPTTTTTMPATTAALTTTTTPTTTETATTTGTSTPAPTTETAATTTVVITTAASTSAPTTTTTTTTTAAPTTTTSTTTTVAFNILGLSRPSIAPLSKLPLQFSIYVDSHHAKSCLDGDYFPIFLSPTPRNGVNLPAFVNHTLEIRVKGTAKYTSILDVYISGPAGTTREKTSKGEYTIKWTPTENEVNDHFPFCFYLEAIDGHHRVYQSELRCVVADVGHHDTIVQCSTTTMKVEVEKSYLIRRNEKNLHLKGFRDAACSLKKLSNSTHLVAVMSLNTCGTTLEEDGDNLVFKNEITSADPNEIISRQHDVEIVFSCVYPKQTNLTLGYRHKNPYAFTERGFSSFTFQFEFFESQRFRKQVDASTYPVEVNLKQMMFMQIEATTSIPNTELFVESCRATPYDNPNSRVSYTIIEHGCVKDNTVQIYPSSKGQFRFGMEAFEFIGAYDEVYITCSVILCQTGVPGTRCSQGCIRSNSGSHRGKREAVAQTSSHFISQGPLHLIKTLDGQVTGPSMNLGVNLMLIATCLLSCVGVVYHSKRSKAKYQLLPSDSTK